MKKESLGLIETNGLVAAIEAADAGTKAAKVTFRGYERARAGLITVVFVGDVAAVRAAVSAGAVAAKQVGTVVSVHVIARPDKQLRVASNGARPVSQQTPAPNVFEQAPAATVQTAEPAVAEEQFWPLPEPSAPAELEAECGIILPAPEEVSVAGIKMPDEAPAEPAPEFGGNGYPVMEEEGEAEVAVSAPEPAPRKKEKVRKTKSRKRS
jgi:microcompartment protein CcmL/EutN